jgi:hypothetical protein
VGGGVIPVVCRVSSPIVHWVSSLSFIKCHPHHSSSVVPYRSSGVVPVVRQVSSPVIHHCSTHGLPHEQLLVRLGAGGAPSSVVHCCCPQSFVIPWSFVVCCPLGHLSSSLSYGPGAPTIHPMSSFSSAWGWVLCQSLSSSMSLLSPVVVVCCHHLLLSFVVIVIHVVLVPHLHRSSSSSSLSSSPSSSPSSSFVLNIPVLIIVPPAVHPTSSCS